MKDQATHNNRKVVFKLKKNEINKSDQERVTKK